MPNDDYLGFLDQRAAQRRLRAKFSQPRPLMLHTVAFVGAVTVLFAVIIPLLRWVPLTMFNPPALIFFGWSILLAAHALWHYRRSSAQAEARELAVEDEMRHLIDAQPLEDEDLFALHHTLAGELQRRGWLTEGLTIFALVNAASWFGASLNLGTTWGFQLTLPVALMLVGGVYGFRAWQHRRSSGHGGWQSRLPLHHIIAYGVGIVLLAVFGAARMVNPWDVDALAGWWTVILLVHIVWALVAAPLLKRALPETDAQTSRVKRKNTGRLALADDGEILSETDAAAKRRPAYRS